MLCSLVGERGVGLEFVFFGESVVSLQLVLVIMWIHRQPSVAFVITR